MTYEIISYSRKTVGNKEYDKIYKAAQDSLKIWSENKLETYRRVWAYNSKLDSTLCFNQSKNRLIGAILVQCDRSICKMDDIHYFYGAKVKDQWHFFIGANLSLPRKAYNSKVDSPLSFQKIHEIATDEIFSGYLTRHESKGEWYINEQFFKGMENKHQSGGGYGNCFECRTFEEYVLHLSKENWRKKAKEEF